MSEATPASASEIDPEIKKWADEADYEALLRRWRFGPMNDPAFQGATGHYVADKLNAARAKAGLNAATISKVVGWDRS